ncbi:MAG: UDP-N-acetylmuramoyl-L-alanine--D-glutamate ligase [Firmicutes bacterium]|nr:UDP-N-acetylmuramoyl-L-alanine--D-glutamate ligase [Bacillota bacterium]
MKRAMKQEWRNKKVAVIGLGRTGLALVRFLKDQGALLSGRDQKTAAQFGQHWAEIQSLGIELVLGPGYLERLGEYEAVFLSPGVPKDLPELRGLDLESEIGLVFRYSQAPLYGITGSSGKTTTTTLVGEMLKESGIPAYLGGNIGLPLIDEIEKIGPEQNLILELSSFQLDNLGQSPAGAVITNISENHLDVHGTMDNYIRAKKNIYRRQTGNDFIILNYDDPYGREMSGESTAKVFFFSLKSKVERGAYLRRGDFIYRDGSEEIKFGRRSELALRGDHNAANFLAAALMSRLIGARWEAIRRVGRSFSGVPHRLELVQTVEGIRYYNDSIATTPERTLAALNSFQEPLLLLAGGSDKKLDYAKFGQAVHEHVKRLILFGQMAPQIKAAVLSFGEFPLDVVETLDQAVTAAAGWAEKGDVVLLSPACASYDQYPNFEVRGAHFRDLVEKLNK